MKIAASVVAIALFVGSFFLFAYAFAVPAPFHLVMFSAGIVAVALSLVIPFHLLERLE